MDEFESLLLPIKEAAEKANELVTEEVAQSIAEDVLEHHKKLAKLTGDDLIKGLAIDTFNDMKHFLRGKIGPLVDALWQVSELRKPLREKALAAAKKVAPT